MVGKAQWQSMTQLVTSCPQPGTDTQLHVLFLGGLRPQPMGGCCPCWGWVSPPQPTHNLENLSQSPSLTPWVIPDSVSLTGNDSNPMIAHLLWCPPLEVGMFHVLSGPRLNVAWSSWGQIVGKGSREALVQHSCYGRPLGSCSGDWNPVFLVRDSTLRTKFSCMLSHTSSGLIED